VTEKKMCKKMTKSFISKTKTKFIINRTVDKVSWMREKDDNMDFEFTRHKTSIEHLMCWGGNNRVNFREEKDTDLVTGYTFIEVGEDSTSITSLPGLGVDHMLKSLLELSSI
jgi:hypothetical protein